MTDNDATITPGQIRISIEVGADYAMSDTLASLLQQVQAEVSDDEVSGYTFAASWHQSAVDFLKLAPPTGSDFLTITMENTRGASYTENDSKGKKKY